MLGPEHEAQVGWQVSILTDKFLIPNPSSSLSSSKLEVNYKFNDGVV